MSKLENKVAVITGTGSGIGRAAAIMFAKEGAKIVGCDLQVEPAEETEQMVRDTGGDIHSTAPVDLADADQVSAWIEDAIAHYGRIDILYNNAGFNTVGPFEQMTEDDWHRTIRNDLDVVYFTTHAVWSHMKAGGGGSIINTSSVTKTAGNSTLLSAHGAAKGGRIASPTSGHRRRPPPDPRQHDQPGAHANSPDRQIHLRQRRAAHTTRPGRNS